MHLGPRVAGPSVIKIVSQDHLLFSVNYELLLSFKWLLPTLILFSLSLNMGGASPWPSSPHWPNPPSPPLLSSPTHWPPWSRWRALNFPYVSTPVVVPVPSAYAHLPSITPLCPDLQSLFRPALLLPPVSVLSCPAPPVVVVHGKIDIWKRRRVRRRKEENRKKNKKQKTYPLGLPDPCPVPRCYCRLCQSHPVLPRLSLYSTENKIIEKEEDREEEMRRVERRTKNKEDVPVGLTPPCVAIAARVGPIASRPAPYVVASTTRKNI